MYSRNWNTESCTHALFTRSSASAVHESVISAPPTALIHEAVDATASAVHCLVKASWDSSQVASGDAVQPSKQRLSCAFALDSNQHAACTGHPASNTTGYRPWYVGCPTKFKLCEHRLTVRIASQTHPTVSILPVIPHRPLLAPVVNGRNIQRRIPVVDPYDSLESPSDLHALAAALYASTFLFLLPFRYGSRIKLALLATEDLRSAPTSLDNVERGPASRWKAFVSKLSLEYILVALFSLVALM